MKHRDYAWLLAVVFMLGYITGMQMQVGSASARQNINVQLFTPTAQITYLVEDPITLDRAIEEYRQSLTATATPLPDNVRIITATPMPTATPRPVIVNDGLTVW